MCARTNSTRQRLIQAALELFISRGVSSTTTRQIAELAEVNEVTLFRHFGNKNGLLLAVIQESEVFGNLGESLVQKQNPPENVYQALKDYASNCLHALEKNPEFVRSVVGEADQYPTENRRALGKVLTEANGHVAEYLALVIQQGHLNTHLTAEKLASLLNGIILGYTAIEFTSEFHGLWEDRDDFLDNLVELFLHGAISSANDTSPELLISQDDRNIRTVADLPANLVNQILRQAKKAGLQDYALGYVLFGAGLSPTEICKLQRSHQIADTRQHILQVTTGEQMRQVPVNQWIMGKRYGSYSANPLTKWLKIRKDTESAMFLNNDGLPISESEIESQWRVWTEGILTPEGKQPEITQTQQTWCVEMLMRGVSLENISIITNWNLAKLEPYARRAKEKAAIEEATRLDRKSNNS